MVREKLEAMQIVMEAGMSACPEFYSGRGAIPCDLNDKILEKVYKGVKREHGEKAAKHFTQMVADIPKLSATDFLLTLYRLESRNWRWDKRMLGNEKGIDVGPDYGDGRRTGIALVTIGDVLGGMSERDETSYIRDNFLERHGIKVPQKNYNCPFFLR
ncbi:MAG: hypothetical protein Q8N63_06075 [Nanoarchaeota archaeon]|nr:hypothetical protein [Nanoarchaeota archaeon]